jgi:hypothetical protein
MLSSLLLAALAAYATALPNPVVPAQAAATTAPAKRPTVYIAGDSTMAPGGGGGATQGVRSTPSTNILSL